MNDERTQSVLAEWFKARDAAPDDVRRSARNVAERRPQVRQRSRWWPFPVFYRKTQASTTDTAAYQPSPIPARNGHTPTVIGRTTSMLSPVKAVTAGAIVFAIGGAFLIAQPFQQQGSVPGANMDVEPVWVTGTIQYAGSCTGPTVEMEDSVQRERDYRCGPQRWTADDPRFTGMAEKVWNADVYVADGESISVVSGTVHLQNEMGGWLCRAYELDHGSGTYAENENDLTAMCTGEGENDGLSALLAWKGPVGSSPLSLSGLVFSGDFPPLPETPAAE
jgi:hypothetical protein